MLTEKLIDSHPMYRRQINLETEAVKEGVRRYRRLVQEAVKRGRGPLLKPGERLVLHWLDPMVEAVRGLQRRCRRQDQYDKWARAYGPYITAIDAERMSVLTIHQTLDRCMKQPEGVTVASVTYAIGNAVIAEAHVDRLADENKPALKEYRKRINFVPHWGWRPDRVNKWAKEHLEDPWTSKRVRIQIGAQLMWHLIGVASASDYDQPFALAFHHETHRRGKRTTKIIRLDDAVFSALEQAHRIRQTMRPAYMPMIVPPMAWQKDTEGGYVRIRTPFISKPTREQKEALADADLEQVYKCLNAVNSTAWRVNERVLDVAQELWEIGGGGPSMPPKHDAPFPPKPHDIDENEEARLAWRREAKQVWDRNVALKAERRAMLSVLDVAKEMRGRDHYYPHQLDFRGRAYPIPPHLNHQGSDLCRGLLEFAEAKPLAGNAGRWLLRHMANLCGVDKVGFADREAWTRANMHVIRGWASDPLENTGWMIDGDGELDDKNAWQKLAAAFALTDPAAAARLPIQVDGTCNGLQHYAAMLRSTEDAAHVNMLPADKPADIYSTVAARTETMVIDDANRGVRPAAVVVDRIGRKTVKQPVMTSVYGVTDVGARKQVMGQLKAAGITGDDLYESSFYLSRLVLRAFEATNSGATTGMKWLDQVAQAITAAGKGIHWTTPLGLPVVQPYRRPDSKRIKTTLQYIDTQFDSSDRPILKGKHRRGFAPNFVHSLDASHMLMTAGEANRESITFAAVHDSYWTHAASMDRLSEILRNQFIILHAEPQLERLSAQLQRVYPDVELPEPPELGDYDLNSVLKANFFFA